MIEYLGRYLYCGAHLMMIIIVLGGSVIFWVKLGCAYIKYNVYAETSNNIGQTFIVINSC
jgi:hypothetical protein